MQYKMSLSRNLAGFLLSYQQNTKTHYVRLRFWSLHIELCPYFTTLCHRAENKGICLQSINLGQCLSIVRVSLWYIRTGIVLVVVASVN